MLAACIVLTFNLVSLCPQIKIPRPEHLKMPNFTFAIL